MEEVATRGEGTSEGRQRLHSLAGVYGLGVFLAFHLVAQASALGGASRYAATVDTIRPWMSAIVDLVVVAALVVHVTVGLGLIRAVPSDARIAAYGDRRLWSAQRTSAVITLGFVIVHVFELRLQRLFFGLDRNALYTVLSARLSWTWAGVPWRALLYIVGTGATSFHFGNGLFAALRRGRRAPTIALAALLFVIGAATVIGIATGTRLLPPSEANSARCGAAPERAPVTVPSR